jgi:hypothetical protein
MVNCAIWNGISYLSSKDHNLQGVDVQGTFSDVGGSCKRSPWPILEFSFQPNKDIYIIIIYTVWLAASETIEIWPVHHGIASIHQVCLSHLNPQHPVTSLTRRARFGSPFSEKLLSMGLIETLPIYGYYNLSQSQWSSMIYSQDLFESGFDLWWKEKHTLTLVLYIIISYVWIWLITDNVWSGDRILPPNNVQQMQTSNLKSNPTLKWSWIVWKHYFH